MSHPSNASSGSPYDAEKDLQHRLSLAAPQYTTRGFLFTSTLRIIQELGQDESVVRDCLAASGEREFLDFYNYPTSGLLQLLAAAARALSDRYGGFEQALRQIGARAGAHLMQTAIGRSARLMDAGDPKQFASTLQSLYGVVASYGAPTMTWTGPRHGVLVLQRSFMPPAYHEGSIQEIARVLGEEGLTVRARGTGELGMELEFTWE